MKDHMARLAEIVKTDLAIQNIKEELEETPAKVREIQEQLSKLESSYNEKKAESDKTDAEFKRLKSGIEDETASVKSREERLNATKTQKEYQAVLKEIASSKTLIKDREAAIVKLQGQVDQIAQVLQPLQGQMDELKPRLEAAQGEIQGKMDELTQNLKSLETQFNEQLSALPEDIMHKYRRIQGKRQPAAAKVVGGTCQECFISVPPQLYIEIQKKQEIQSCPNCHRLLYIEFD